MVFNISNVFVSFRRIHKISSKATNIAQLLLHGLCLCTTDMEQPFKAVFAYAHAWVWEFKKADERTIYKLYIWNAYAKHDTHTSKLRQFNGYLLSLIAHS